MIQPANYCTGNRQIVNLPSLSIAWPAGGERRCANGKMERNSQRLRPEWLSSGGKLCLVEETLATFNLGSSCHEILESRLPRELRLASVIEMSLVDSKFLLLLFAVLNLCFRSGSDRPRLRLWKHGILSPRSFR